MQLYGNGPGKLSREFKLPDDRMYEILNWVNSLPIKERSMLQDLIDDVTVFSVKQTIRIYYNWAVAFIMSVVIIDFLIMWWAIS